MCCHHKLLEFEFLGLLPWEALVGEMPILRRPAIDGVGQVQLLDNNAWTEIKVVANSSQRIAQSKLPAFYSHQLNIRSNQIFMGGNQAKSFQLGWL